MAMKRLASLAVIALCGCGETSADRLHSEIVDLDHLGTPAWRTGPNEVETPALKAARITLGETWFPPGMSQVQATQILSAEGYDVLPLSEGWISGQRSGRLFCRPGTEVHLLVEGQVISRADVMTIPAFTLLGGTIC